MDAKKLQQVLGHALKQAGFARKGQTWFLDSKESVVVANLQKDRYGAVFYLNLGFWLKELGDPPTLPPGEHLCHVRIRAERLFPEQSDNVIRLLDPGNDLPEDVWAAGLERLLVDTVVPFLKAAADSQDLRKHIEDGRFHQGMVHVDAQRVLRIPEE